MRAKLAAISVALLFGVTAMSCGPNARQTGDGCAGICSALGYQACGDNGTFEPPVACNPDETCDPVAGLRGLRPRRSCTAVAPPTTTS